MDEVWRWNTPLLRVDGSYSGIRQKRELEKGVQRPFENRLSAGMLRQGENQACRGREEALASFLLVPPDLFRHRAFALPSKTPGLQAGEDVKRTTRSLSGVTQELGTKTTEFASKTGEELSGNVTEKANQATDKATNAVKKAA